MENERNLPEIPIATDEKDCDLISSNAAQALFAEAAFGKIVLTASLY